MGFRTAACLLCVFLPWPAAAGWKLHVIDASSQGADGVRLADVNGDSLPDVATGWEEGGSVRVYLNPGPARARQPWPKVVVGSAGSPEDAVLADLDGDGATDVISSCEGGQRAMFVHWAPKDPREYLNSSSWTTSALPAAAGRMLWMFATPAQIDGRNGADLVAGGKGEGAALGWFASPADPRDLAGWKWRPLRAMGWTMSILATDMDGDADLDILASDRRKASRGVFWLENPTWREHTIGGGNAEVMFLSTADLDGDQAPDVLAAVKPRTVLFHRRASRDGRSWKTFPIRIPEEAGTAKAVRAGDIDGDGRLDLVFTCEQAEGGKRGVMWLSYRQSPFESVWTAHDISGAPGVKYDLVELIDLDGDGDLDVLTCEERENLGVIWYENPAR